LYLYKKKQIKHKIMAIYTEELDGNINAGAGYSNKELIIDEINQIVEEFGEFTIADVEAEHSPYVETKGRLTHLMEEFREGGGTVRVYDPTSYSSDEIDEYDEFYEALDKNQLNYIWELAEQWAEQNKD
jgi:hypothetical protein